MNKVTDRDRLIELNRKAKLYAQEKADERGGLVCIDDEADYLLANGVIVPPCKAGDIVWFDTYKKNGTVSLGIQPHKVDRIDVVCVVGEKELIETKLHDWYFGKTVFLTKEEAEEKLKELGK